MPDRRLDTAAKAVAKLKPLSACPDPATCLASPCSPDRYTPPAAAHLHVDFSDVTVGLYPQSDTLCFLPPLEISLASDAQDDDVRVPPYFCLASDRTALPPWRPGRASGAFQTGHHPVLVPRAHVLLEAFLRLYARDSDKKIGSFGMAMISYVEEYVDDNGLLDAEQLPEPLRTLYGDLRTGRTPVRQWTRDLKEALGVPVEHSEHD